MAAIKEDNNNYFISGLD